MKRAISVAASLLCAWLLPTTATAHAKPLKVFILAGQSNMEGHAKIETFDYLGDDPATAPLLQKMRGPDGNLRVCDNVWISYFTGSGDDNGEGFGKLTAGYGARSNPQESGGKIGPEFTFGITLEETLEEPVLIIKTAWGGEVTAHRFSPAERRALCTQRLSEEAVLRAKGSRCSRGYGPVAGRKKT